MQNDHCDLLGVLPALQPASRCPSCSVTTVARIFQSHRAPPGPWAGAGDTWDKPWAGSLCSCSTSTPIIDIYIKNIYNIYQYNSVLLLVHCCQEAFWAVAMISLFIQRCVWLQEHGCIHVSALSLSPVSRAQLPKRVSP